MRPTHIVQFTDELVLTEKGRNNEDTGRDSMFPSVSYRAYGRAASGRPRTDSRLASGQSPRS